MENELTIIDRAQVSLVDVQDTADSLSNCFAAADNFVANSTQLLDLFGQCVIVHEQTKQLEAWSTAKIAETAAKFKTCQNFLDRTFGERETALSHHYALLDKAVLSNDKELVLAALKGISEIVTKSPLEDFEQFVKLYEDTSMPLLDF